ncbi:MAG: (d)CMP kinase [Acidimicrobiia bacterium]
MTDDGGGARVVAIDGPSGSGKSTVARGVGEELGLRVLDTGAMYRAVTVAALEAGIDITDAELVAAVVANVRMEVEGTVLLDGHDVSAAIRAPAVTASVSTVSAHPGVRRELVARQRAWVAAHGGGVVEGRDIGTVVFPAAPVKVYLEAGERERARRRQRDEAAADRDVAVDDVRDALARRDAIDTGRAASPLRVADDAIIIDATHRSVDEIVTEIVTRFRAATEAHTP